ncbi:hypothetical protein DFH09DRAFT_1441321 [Mycena vulgaris]|nr:hypothetical protein DFH09DRAFT_1441321 [Mycena vulgaris]
MNEQISTRKKRKVHPPRDKRSIAFGRKTGSMAWVLTTPLDILFEVFGHLTPSDVLVLARTTKALRRVLMHRSSISVWRAALRNVPGLPDMPPEMSEPAWANLVFDRHCHYCLAKGVKNIQWRVRLRLCHPCTLKYIVKMKYRGPEQFRGLHWSIPAHRVTLLVSIIPAKFNGCRIIYLQQDYENATDSFVALKDDPVAQEKFVSEGKDRALQIDQHAALCEVWANIQAHTTAQELCDIFLARYYQIKDKFKALGYDVDAMDPYDLEGFKRHPLVKQKQPLTPRVWKRIKHPLLRYLEERKPKPFAKEHEIISDMRRRFALAVMRRFRDCTMFPTKDLAIANFPDSSLLVHSILRAKTGIPLQIQESDFATRGVDILHGLFDEWRNTIQDRLLNQVASAQAPNAFVSEDNDSRCKISIPAREQLLRQLSLAKMIFTCECSHIDLSYSPGTGDPRKPSSRPCAIKPLFYPQVLGHICLHRTPELPELDEDFTATEMVFSTFRLSQGYPGPQAWDCSNLRLNPFLGELVQSIILSTHLDPETATVQDMDELDGYFACMSCAVQDEDEIELYDTDAFRWREAVRHAYAAHGAGHRDVAWQMLTAAQVEEGLRDGVGRSPDEGKTWICTQCALFVPELGMDLDGIIEHLKSSHTILEPKRDIDYYQDFSAPTCGYEDTPRGTKVCLMYDVKNLQKV